MDNSQELLSCRAPCRTKDAATLTRGRSLFQHFSATKSGPSWIQLTCACWRERPAVLHLTHCVASSHLYHLCLSTESKSIACATIRVPRKGGGGVGSEVSVSLSRTASRDRRTSVSELKCVSCVTHCVACNWNQFGPGRARARTKCLARGNWDSHPGFYWNETSWVPLLITSL